MSTRYVERYRLPGRRYTKSSPVILSDGALLEDTETPRLVVQLKFKSISPRIISRLTVAVLCYGADGVELERRAFTYGNLRIRQGREFGQFTALALPVSEAQSFAAIVISAVFADGARWTREQSSVTQAVEVPEEPVAAPAAATVIEEPEARSAERELLDAVMPAPGRERRKVRMRPKWIVIPAALVAAVIAAFIFLPDWLGGIPGSNDAPAENTSPEDAPESTKPEAGPYETAEPEPEKQPVLLSVTTPYDNGTVFFDMTSDENGICELWFDDIQAALPQVTALTLTSSCDMGGDINPYIVDSQYMSYLVATGGRNTLDRQSSRFVPENYSSRPLVLLLFSDENTLCGYSAGNPEEVQDGVFRFVITLCEYDFTELYNECRAAYGDAEPPLYIPPEGLSESGAKWFLQNNINNPYSQTSIRQSHIRLLSQFSSPYLESFCRDMSTFEERAPTGGTARNPRSTHYYLLDKDFNLLGYTALFSPENAPDTLNLKTPYDTGGATLYLEEDEYGNLLLPKTELLKHMPQLFHMTYGRNMHTEDIDDYITFTYEFARMSVEGSRTKGYTYDAYINADYHNRYLFFSDATTLCGYLIGSPSLTEDGRWAIEITLCDYDFNGLLEQRAREFKSAEPPPFISPENVRNVGAAWYIDSYGNSVGSNDLQIELCHFWNASISPVLASMCLEFEDFENYIVNNASGSADGTQPNFLLLDKNYEIIGYSKGTFAEFGAVGGGG